jgi:Tol biopolymer transport system component
LGPLAPENATVLVVRTVKTGEERDIRLPLQIPAYPVIAAPKWFPDGHSVLVVGWVSRQPGFGYFRVDLASGKTELLHRPQGPQRTGLGPGRLDLSPDGKSIYYLDGALRRFDIDTGQDTEVRKMVTAEGQLAISPDGKLIALAYRSADAYDESIAIYIAVIAGGEPRLVYQMGKGVDQNSFQATLTWTKDQRYLLFGQPDNAVKPKGSALWRIPVAGGEPEKLGISLKGVFKTPRIHPDGRRIAYESIEGSGDEVWALGNFLPEVKGK